MKKTFLTTTLLLTILLLTGCANNQEQVKVNTEKNQPNFTNVSEEGYTDINNEALGNVLANSNENELSESERAGLIFMREEEKLAYDVYAFLYEKWGKKTFSNIASSELTHTNSVKTLLNYYQIEDPAQESELGLFSNETLQTLYTQLTEKGSQSLIEALKVGALIEEIDIIDLEKYIEETQNENIRLVYENLMRGSRNHLRAYVRNLEKEGVSYSPEQLSTEAYNKIINGDVETGYNGSGDRKNSGNGKRGRR